MRHAALQSACLDQPPGCSPLSTTRAARPRGNQEGHWTLSSFAAGPSGGAGKSGKSGKVKKAHGARASGGGTAGATDAAAQEQQQQQQQPSADTMPWGTFNQRSFRRLRDSRVAAPLAFRPEPDGGSQGGVGLASNALQWGRQLTLAAVRSRDAAIAVQRQAEAAKAIADYAAVQADYAMNHPCLRAEKGAAKGHSDATAVAQLHQQEEEQASKDLQASIEPEIQEAVTAAARPVAATPLAVAQAAFGLPELWLSLADSLPLYSGSAGLQLPSFDERRGNLCRRICRSGSRERRVPVNRTRGRSGDTFI
eukprot:TRINITY_DN893_c2_g4_i1.p1 TRINITY_DN893_c2_g4~~TRINITY_DN893_c2_g4_i1.p1  ORF type:complete len:309 (+),score=61.01 TRINITY_DN893_c2_g4_i1:160-1086(+)